MKNQEAKKIKKELNIFFNTKITNKNINDFYDLIYDYLMKKLGETSSETEIIIKNLFKTK